MALEPECVHSANQDNLMCMICQDTMKDPHLVSCCSKSFCKSCISKLHERHKEKKRCPNCNKQGFRSVLNLDLRNVIDDQLVYCSYKSDGCKWEGRRGEFEAHIKQSCEYLMIECEHGCGHKCFRRDKKNHLASDGVCLNSRLKRALAALESKEGQIKELQTAAKTAAKMYKKKLEKKQSELQDLNQRSENLQKKGKRLESELQDLQSGRQRIQNELQDLQREKQRLTNRLQDQQIGKQLMESELKMFKQREQQIVVRHKNDEAYFGFGVLVLLLLWYFHYQYYSSVNLPRIVKTEVTEYVSLKYNHSWQINVEHCWKFELFVANVYSKKEELYVNFGARISLPNPSHSFQASVIVQVYNSSGHNHHVSRIDTLFRADTVDENWYTTNANHLMTLSGPHKNFISQLSSELKLRIVNVEYGANDILPYHFSMCHLKRYQKYKQLKWYTFPFYINGYKFVIFIYANGHGSSKGKALTLTAYQMDFQFSEKIDINVKIRKKSGAYTEKRLSVTGGVTDKFVKIIFPENNRFFQYDYRSKHGVSFDIPHSDLQEYVDDDCLIFDIVSDTEPYPV